jgi:hypothetical protein
VFSASFLHAQSLANGDDAENTTDHVLNHARHFGDSQSPLHRRE